MGVIGISWQSHCEFSFLIPPCPICTSCRTCLNPRWRAHPQTACSTPMLRRPPSRRLKSRDIPVGRRAHPLWSPSISLRSQIPVQGQPSTRMSSRSGTRPTPCPTPVQDRVSIAQCLYLRYPTCPRRVPFGLHAIPHDPYPRCLHLLRGRNPIADRLPRTIAMIAQRSLLGNFSL